MRKFGCILPSILQLPWDLHSLLPSDVQANVATLNVRNGRPGEFERALGILRGATDVLVDEGSEAIVVQGVPVAARIGFVAEREAHAALTADRGGVPVISSLAASVLALRELGTRRALLITQYNAEVNQQIVQFFRDAGLEVAGAVGLGATNAKQVNALTVEDYALLARRALDAHPEAEGIFLSARGNLLDLAIRLESTQDVPVIEQVQATAWWSLARLGCKPRESRGRLLARLAQAA